MAQARLSGVTTTKEVAAPTEAFVRFMGHINSDSAAALMADITDSISKGVQRVTLVLTTQGGSIDAGMQLYSELRALPIALATHAFELVASMGIAVYLAGAERSTGPKAKFMLHPSSVQIEAGQRATAGQLMEAANKLEERDRREREIIMDRTSLSAEETKALNGVETWLDAGEAVEKGFASEIKDVALTDGAWYTELGPYAEPEKG
jgi:ATP-dependent protease ClpP protease subunit